MKTLATVAVLIIVSSQSFCQEIVELQSALDSLKALRSSYQMKLSEVDQEYNRIQDLINEKRFEQSLGEIYYCVTGTSITKSPATYEPIGKLKYGDKVKIVDKDQNNYKILFNDTMGWVIKTALRSEAEYKALVESKRVDAQRKNEEALKVKEEAQRAALVEEQNRRATLTKKFGADIAQQIIDGRVWIGMTSEMALESVGKPNDINRSVGSWGVHEQWVYGDRVYLYFENGKLTSWQD